MSTERMDGGDSVQVRMLGGFDMKFQGGMVSDSIGRTHQLWNLLEYLIANRHKVISQQELIDTLWPDDSSDSPANALKNLIYRIRTALSAAGAERVKELIVYRNGTYHWNERVRCEVDADQFETLVLRMESDHIPTEERIACATEALALYRGDYLPLSAYEKWVVPLLTYYRGLYFRCVYQLCDLLMAQERFAQMEAVCMQASKIDPFEERAHRYYITALVRQNKPTAALTHYNYVTEMYYRELGVKPSEEMRRIYRDIAGTLSSIATDLDVIKEDLSEKKVAEGAFCCDYEVFKNMYRIEARSAARTGQLVFIGLLTVTDPQGGMPERVKLNRVMDELVEVIRTSLRKGDVVARFSATQYVLMLPTLTFENGERVLMRICRRYRSEYRGRNVTIHISLQPLDPIE